MARAAIYARISFDPEGRSDSPEDQAARCQVRATELHFEATSDDVFTDRSISAYKDTKRPELLRLLEAVEDGRYKAVIVWKLDRLTRHYRRGNEIIRRILDAGVTLVSVTEHIDTGTPIGEAIVGFQLAQAQSESDNTSKRNTRKHATWAAQGVPAVGGNRSFGYRHIPAVDGQPARLEPEPTESKAIRQIVKRIMKGESLRSCAQWLNDNGITTTTGGPWTGQTLRQMLRNPTLAGLRKLNGIETAGNWKAIISPEEREELLCYFASVTPSGSEPVKRLLSGILKCGRCGAPMYVSAGRYVCYKAVGSDACGSVSSSVQRLEVYVIDQLFTFLSAAEVGPTQEAVDPETIRNSIEAAIARLREWDRKYAVLGEIEKDEWQPIHDELVNLIESGRQALSAAERRAATTLRPGSRTDLEAWWQEADINAKKQALAHTVEQIWTFPMGEIKNRFDPSRIRITWRWDAFERSPLALAGVLSDIVSNVPTGSDDVERLREFLQDPSGVAILHGLNIHDRPQTSKARP